MTTTATPMGASSTALNHIDLMGWHGVPWNTVMQSVRRLQMRIAKAYRDRKYGKAKALQWILTHSFYPKLLAVKRVTESKGAKTPGIDKVVWHTAQQKMTAALSLKRRGYRTQPLRRIYIPKKQKGTWRPLSIPVMECRAQQALHLLGLEPIIETIADKNAYGFRPHRSTADAHEQCFKSLSKRTSALFILEGDIKSCFDTISHTWLLDNIPMDKTRLKQWLLAGYMEKGILYATDQGTPQGGVISPGLLVLTLAGMEQAIKACTTKINKINVCIYADDFIITGVTKEVLENQVMPTVEAFLNERGLKLSQEKTKITHIHDGFDFLGVNIRKYRGKLIMKPAKSNVQKFMENIKETVKHNKTAKTENLIHQLNPKIRGWANYHRHICAKSTYNTLGSAIYWMLWRWAKRRHPNKSTKWMHDKYFRSKGLRHWVFSTQIKKANGERAQLDLFDISSTPIRRHVKIRANATPYDPHYQEYFLQRQKRQKEGLVLRTTVKEVRHA